MTREQAEQAILEHLKAIRAICKEYAPEDDYCTLHFAGSILSFNNTYYNPDVTHHLNFFIDEDDQDSE